MSQMEEPNVEDRDVFREALLKQTKDFWRPKKKPVNVRDDWITQIG